MDKKLVFVVLAVILALSFFVRIYPIQTVHWWDETVYLQHAEIISGLKENNYDELNLRPPLLSIIFALGFLIWHTAITASVLVALIGALGVLYMYLLGQKIYNKKLGLIAALFLGLVPFIAQQSRTLMTDVPALTFFTIALYYFISYYKEKKNLFGIIAGIFFALSVLTKFTAILILLFVPLYIFLQKNNFTMAGFFEELKKFKVVMFSFLATLAPYFIWTQIEFGNFILPFISAMFAVSSGSEGFEFYIFNLEQTYSIIILIGFLLFLIFFLKDKIQDKIIDRNDLFLLVSFVAIIIFMSFTPHKEARYLITLLSIPIILLSARGIHKTINLTLKRNAILKILVITGLILITVFSFQASFERINEPFINPKITTEEYEVSEFINKLNMPKENVIYANHNYPVFAYYTELKVIRLKEVGEDFYQEYPKNMKKHGILVLYNDSLDPTEEWAKKQAEFSKIKKFDNISLYSYSPN